AFDTIYAEGQRKYMESLSAYARQFLDQLQKPDLDEVEGLPPTIAIEQRHASSNPRSIVATTTEIYDYLRVLFARAGTPHCRECGRESQPQQPSQIVAAVMKNPPGTNVLILSPLGACPECHGLGTTCELDPELIVPDESLSLENGAVEAWRKNGKRMNIFYSRVLRQFCRDFEIGYTAPYKDIPKKIRDILMYG